MFSIYQVLPKMIELWGLNVGTDVEITLPRTSEQDRKIIQERAEAQR